MKCLINRKIYWALEVPNLALLASMFAIAAIVWPSLPALLPVHWTGLPPAIPMHIDGYGGKVQALLLWPTLAVGLYALLLFAPKLGQTIPEGGTASYSIMRLIVTGFLAAQYLEYVLYYKGFAIDLNAWDRNSLIVMSIVVVAGVVWQLVSRHLRGLS